MKDSLRFILISMISLIVGCSKDNDVIEDDDLAMEIQYDIESLIFDESSYSIDTIEHNNPTFYYINNTSVKQEYTIKSDGITDKSQFQTTKGFNYKLIDSTKLFTVPHEIRSGNFIYGEKKWEFSQNQTNQQTELDFIKYIEIESRKKLTLDFSVIYVKYEVPFLIKLKNTVSNDYIDVKGKWIGIFAKDTISTYNFSSL